MKAAFPYFGSKHRVAPVIWDRFGDPSYYYEPFGGTVSNLLARPEGRPRERYEYVCDSDCLITNFYRAVQLGDPMDLADLADWPANGIELESRARWISEQRQRLHQRLLDDPDWFDPKCAAWFAWMQSVRLGTKSISTLFRRTAGVRRRNQDLPAYFAELANRLKDVTIHFGDWTKLANAAAMESRHSSVAILLDPPYSYRTGREKRLYATDSADVASYVCRWALAVAKTRPRLRIALCGYAGEHQMPASWSEFAWSSKLGKGRERIWFSPSCQ